jgi:hypothetical protein
MKIKESKEYFKFLIPKFTGIFEFSDGTEHYEWIAIRYMKNGKPHRENGPAVEWSNRRKEWWLNGINYSEKD